MGNSFISLKYSFLSLKASFDHYFRAAVGSSNSENAKKSRNSNKDFSQESDSFYKYYNKEIKVN